MTNGGSPAHGLKRKKKASKSKAKGLKMSLKKKGLLPAGLARERNA